MSAKREDKPQEQGRHRETEARAEEVPRTVPASYYDEPRLVEGYTTVHRPARYIDEGRVPYYSSYGPEVADYPRRSFVRGEVGYPLEGGFRRYAPRVYDDGYVAAAPAPAPIYEGARRYRSYDDSYIAGAPVYEGGYWGGARRIARPAYYDDAYYGSGRAYARRIVDDGYAPVYSGRPVSTRVYDDAAYSRYPASYVEARPTEYIPYSEGYRTVASTTAVAPAAVPASSYSSSRLALDAADGRIDGHYFGSRIL